MGNNIRSSSRPKALAPSIPMPPLADAMDAVHLSVDRFCLLAGVEALAEMMEEDATTVCGARHRRHGDRRGYRWGRTHSEIGYHGGKVKVARPRVRDRAGKEVSLESWQALRDGNLLLEWALNLMVLNVSTRKYHRAVRLPEGDLAKARGDGTSKSAVSRRFVALSRKKMKAWLASDLSELDPLERVRHRQNQKGDSQGSQKVIQAMSWVKGGQPWMTRPYSEDLRERVVRVVESGTSRNAAANQFDVSISFVVKLMQRWKQRGTIKADKYGGWKKSKLAPHGDRIRALVMENCDITIDELCVLLAAEGIEAKRSTLGDFLLAQGLSRKKRQPTPPSRSALTSRRREPLGATSNLG